MPVDYRAMASAESRVNKNNKIAQAISGALNLAGQTVDLTSEILKYKQQKEDEIEAAEVNDLNTTIDLMSGQVTRVNGMIGEINDNPSLTAQQKADESNRILEENFGRDALVEYGASVGRTEAQIDAYMQSDKYKQLSAIFEYSILDQKQSGLMAEYGQSITSSYANLAETGIAADFNDYLSLCQEKYDTSDKGIYDKYGVYNPSNSKVKSYLAAYYYQETSKDKFAEMLNKNSFTTEEEAVNSVLSSYDSGFSENMSDIDRANVDANRDTLEQNLKTLFAEAQANHDADVTSRVNNANYQYESLKLQSPTGIPTLEQAWQITQDNGFRFDNSEELAFVANYIADYSASLSTMSQQDNQNNIKYLNQLLNGNNVKVEYSAERKGDADIMDGVINEFTSDQYTDTSYNQLTRAVRQNPEMLNVGQNVMDFLNQAHEALVARDYSATSKNICETIIYDSEHSSDQEWKAAMLEIYRSEGLVSQEDYITYSGKIESSSTSAFSDIAVTATESAKAYLDTLGLDSETKNTVSYLALDSIKAKTNILNLVKRNNGGNLDQAVRQYIDDIVELSIQEDLYNNLLKTSADVMTDIVTSKTPSVSTREYSESILFSDSGENSFYDFYHSYLNGEYDNLIDKSHVAELKSVYLNMDKNKTTKEEILDSASEICYGVKYTELPDWKANIIDITALSAFGEALQIRDLANAIDKSEKLSSGDEYREVNIPTVGKGLMTKSGTVYFCYPEQISTTWSTRTIRYFNVDKTSDAYMSIWGSGTESSDNAYVIIPALTSQMHIPIDENGNFVPISNTRAYINASAKR